jgi:alginate O-acetyltransferase complex protein AlgI
MGLLSLGFVLFFTIVCLLYWRVPARWQVPVLLAASLVFYAAWNAGLLAMLLGATVVNHLIARRLEPGSRARLSFLRLGIIFQCGLLFAFKYFAFFVGSAQALLARGGVVADPLVLEILAPLGLSYYCLKAIAYLVDTYRGQVQGRPGLPAHALYLLFFPSLTAGPIDRPQPFLAQLAPAARPGWRQALPRGADLLFAGVLKKSVIANGLLPAVDRAFAGDFASSGAAALAAVTYATYIYADFSGYTDIARGLAASLGFDLMVNFRRPYAARSTSEFWQRWHISLSTWLRDYVFLPLGGAFRSRGRAYANLLLTMLLAGLWHGPSWLFVLWGLYIGALLVGHRMLQPALRRWRGRLRLRGRLRRVVETGLTFALISAGWLLFRGTGLGQVASALRGGLAAGESWRAFLTGVAPFALLLVIFDLMSGAGEPVLLRGARLPWWGKPILLAAGLYAVLILGSDTQSFVYAQF